MKLLGSLLILFFPILTQAAPHPATGSSLLTDPTKGVFFHGFGFRLKSLASTNWTPTPVLSEMPLESLRFKPMEAGPDRKDASISIHLEKLRSPQSLESYARRWMKEYSSYGFEVLGTKGVLLNGEKSLLVDLTQNKKNRQLRQAILQKSDRIVVVTCLDRKDRFQETLGACNQFLRGFEWALPSVTAPATTSH